MFLSRDIVGKEVIRHIFLCRCGSNDCKKISFDGVPTPSFYEGYFMCTLCGTSLDSDGNLLCYYSPNFHRVSDAIQLNLF